MQKQVRLKYIARFEYGEAFAGEKVQGETYKVFGSNGPYAHSAVANTLEPVIIIGRKGSYGKINWSQEMCFASDTTFFIDARYTNFNLRWLYYVLQTLDLDSGSNEAAVPGLSRDDAYEHPVLLPATEIQQVIADYLDHETTRIDSLITEKENWLTLLAEKRRSLIMHSVTRGLNPDVPLRDSGLSWLGHIPAHWQIERTRWLFQERDQRSSSGDEELLTVSHITGVTPRAEKEVNMFEAETTEGYKICRCGDLVINTMWAWMGAMGISPVDGIASPSYNVYTPCNQLAGGYLDALVRTPAFIMEATRFSKGVWASRLRLYPDEFFQILIPVPPLEEQYAIAAHVTAETRKIDALRTATERTIALLRERRAALIAATVTGQISVGSLQ